jgi:hypothetical protein
MPPAAVLPLTCQRVQHALAAYCCCCLAVLLLNPQRCNRGSTLTCEHVQHALPIILLLLLLLLLLLQQPRCNCCPPAVLLLTCQHVQHALPVVLQCWHDLLVASISGRHNPAGQRDHCHVTIIVSAAVCCRLLP